MVISHQRKPNEWRDNFYSYEKSLKAASSNGTTYYEDNTIKTYLAMVKHWAEWLDNKKTIPTD